MYQDYKNVEHVKPGGLELKDRLVGVQRVTKVTKGGRAFGFSAIVVAFLLLIPCTCRDSGCYYCCLSW